jgi:hypothetical protein
MEDTPCSAHTSISRRMRTVLFEPQLIKEWGGLPRFIGLGYDAIYLAASDECSIRRNNQY